MLRFKGRARFRFMTEHDKNKNWTFNQLKVIILETAEMDNVSL